MHLTTVRDTVVVDFEHEGSHRLQTLGWGFHSCVLSLKIVTRWNFYGIVKLCLELSIANLQDNLESHFARSLTGMIRASDNSE